jgi:hypothetical protein
MAVEVAKSFELFRAFIGNLKMKLVGFGRGFVGK